MSSLVLVSLVPESLATTSSSPAILTLASHISADIASLVLIFLALVKLVPTFLATPPALYSPLFSLAPISLTLLTSSTSPVHVSLIPATLFLPSLIPYSLTSAVPIYPFSILEMLRI